MPRVKPIIDFIRELNPGSSDDSSEPSLCLPTFERRKKWQPVHRTPKGDMRIRRSIIDRNFADREPPPFLDKNSTPSHSVRKSFGTKTILSLSPIVLNKTINNSHKLPEDAPEHAPEQTDQRPPTSAPGKDAAKRQSSSLDSSGDKFYIPKKANIADTIADEFADNSDDDTPLEQRQRKKKRHRSRAPGHSTRLPQRQTTNARLTIVQKVRDMGTEVTDSLKKPKTPKGLPKWVPKSSAQAEILRSILGKTRTNNSESSLTSEISSKQEDNHKKNVSIQCEQTLVEDSSNDDETLTNDLNKTERLKRDKSTREGERQKNSKGKVNIISNKTVVPPQTFYSHGKTKDAHRTNNGIRTEQNPANELETTLNAKRKQNVDAQMAFLQSLGNAKSFNLSKSTHGVDEDDDTQEDRDPATPKDRVQKNVTFDDTRASRKSRRSLSEDEEIVENDIIEDFCSSMKMKEVLNRSKSKRRNDTSTLNNTKEGRGSPSKNKEQATIRQRDAQNQTGNEENFNCSESKVAGQRTGNQSNTREDRANSFDGRDIVGNDGMKPRKTGRKEGPTTGSKNNARDARPIVSDGSDDGTEEFDVRSSPAKKTGATSKGHKVIQNETANKETFNASKNKKASKEGHNTGNKNHARDAQPVVSDYSDNNDEEDVRASPSKQKGQTSKGHKTVHNETGNKESCNALKAKTAAPKEGPKTGSKNNARDARPIVSDGSDDGAEEFDVRSSPAKKTTATSKGHKVIQCETANKETFNASKNKKASKEGHNTGNKNHARDAQPVVSDYSDNNDEEDVRASPSKQKGQTSKGHKTVHNETGNKESCNALKAKTAAPKEGPKTGSKNNARDARPIVSDGSDDGAEEFDVRSSPAKKTTATSKGHKVIQCETANKETFNASKNKKASKEGHNTGNKNHARDAQPVVSDYSDNNDEEDVRASPSKQKGQTSKGHKTVHNETGNKESCNALKAKTAAPKEGPKTGSKNNARDARPIVSDGSDDSAEEFDVRFSPEKNTGATSKGNKVIQNKTSNIEKQGSKEDQNCGISEQERSIINNFLARLNDFDNIDFDLQVRTLLTKAIEKVGQNQRANKENLDRSNFDTGEAQRRVFDDLEEQRDGATEDRGLPSKRKEHASKSHKHVQNETANKENFNASTTRDAQPIVSDYYEEFEVRASPTRKKGQTKGAKSFEDQTPNEKISKIKKTGLKTGHQDHTGGSQKRVFDDVDNSEALVSIRKKRGRPPKVHKNEETSNTKKTGSNHDVTEHRASPTKQRGRPPKNNEDNFNGSQTKRTGSKKGNTIDATEAHESVFDDLLNSDDVAELRASPTKRRGRPPKNNEENFNGSKSKKTGTREGPKTGNENSARDAKEEIRRSLFDDFVVPEPPIQKIHKAKRTIDDRQKKTDEDDLGSTIDEDGYRLTESRIVTNRSDDDDFSEDEGPSPRKRFKASEKEASKSRKTHQKNGKKDESRKVKKASPMGRAAKVPKKVLQRVESPKLSADDGYSSETATNVVVLDVRRSGRVRTARKCGATFTIINCGRRLMRKFEQINECSAPVDVSNCAISPFETSRMRTKAPKKTAAATAADRIPEEEDDEGATPAAKKRGRKKKDQKELLRDEVKAKRGRKTKISAVILEEAATEMTNDENDPMDANVGPPPRGAKVSESLKKPKGKKTTVEKKKKVAEKVAPKVRGRPPSRKKVSSSEVADRSEEGEDDEPQEGNPRPEGEIFVEQRSRLEEDDGWRSSRDPEKAVVGAGEVLHDFFEAGRRTSDGGSRSSSGSNVGENAIEFPVDGVVQLIKVCTSDVMLWKTTEGNETVSLAEGLSHRNNQTGSLVVAVGGHKSSQILRKSDMFIFVHHGSGKFAVHNKVMFKSVGQTILVPLGTRYSITNVSETEDLVLHFFNSRHELP